MASNKSQTKNESAKRESGQRTRFEKYTCREIHRSQIQNAIYNPRVISEKSKIILRENIQRVGLNHPIVWNERTGNIVGGHQRISQLDTLEGTQDYRLTVAVVDYDDKTEREQNIFLNNANAQGDWDLVKLEELIKEVDVDLTGFDMGEIYQLFGDGIMVEQSEAVMELAEQVHETRARYENILKKNASKRDNEAFYSVLVFKDNEQREAFSKLLGLEDNRWVNGMFVFERLKKASPDAEISPVSTEQVP